MVVNYKEGIVIDQCDSLLFSSLRYVALKKLGFDFAAKKAWSPMLSSSENGEWFRHPKCKHLGTSKDMLLGLLSALSQSPNHHKQAIRDLIKHIEINKGYFSFGPVYLSYLTPTVAKQLRRIAHNADVPYKNMPNSIRRGFSTNEFTHYFIDGGFKSHLSSLIYG